MTWLSNFSSPMSQGQRTCCTVYLVPHSSLTASFTSLSFIPPLDRRSRCLSSPAVRLQLFSHALFLLNRNASSSSFCYCSGGCRQRLFRSFQRCRWCLRRTSRQVQWLFHPLSIEQHRFSSSPSNQQRIVAKSSR